jgi:hypothetical protein
MSWARIVGMAKRNKSFLTFPVPRISFVGVDILTHPFDQGFEEGDLFGAEIFE